MDNLNNNVAEDSKNNTVEDAVEINGASVSKNEEQDTTKKNKSVPDSLLVYNQHKMVRKLKDTVYTDYRGEDAYPYIDEELLFVADGMGGTGALPHTKFHKELFDEDKVVEALFKGVFDDITDERFSNYVKKSFFELRAIKDYYFSDSNNTKHSAYFGSRILGAVIIQMMKENADRLSASKIFDEINSAENKDEKLVELGEFVTSYLYEYLPRVCKNANIIVEKENPRLKLLATALCAAIYRESDDYVEVIYLNAGDSKAYMWDADGLHQSIKDHESPSGGLTNFVCISDTRKFTIVCEYRRFNKPCVLFNATDGCFDAFPFAVTPIAFEKYLLETLIEHETLEDAAKTMGEFFMSPKNANDDSSTMALRMFGYGSLDAFKEAARLRLQSIENEYLSEFPGLIKYDLKAQINMLNQDIRRKSAALKSAMLKSEEVKNYCKTKMLRRPEGDFAEVYIPLKRKITACENTINAPKRAIKDIFTTNYLYWLESFGISECSTSIESRKNVAACKTAVENAIAAFDDEVCEYQQMVNDICGRLNDLLLKGRGFYSVPELGEFDDKYMADMFKSMTNTVAAVCGYVKKIRGKDNKPTTSKNEKIKGILRAKNAYLSSNRGIAENNANIAAELEIFIEKIKDCDIDSIDIFPEQREILKTSLPLLLEKRAELEALVAEKDAYIANEIPKYIEISFEELAKKFAGDNPGITDASIISQAKELRYRLTDVTADFNAKYDLQKALFEKYDAEYLKFILIGEEQ